MILNRLWLTNCGPFRGENEFVLTPGNGRDGRPRRVVLFGGKNGSGKTSILTAVRLCLFGPLAFGERVGEREYAKRLAAFAHRPGDKDVADDLSAVELEFDYVIMGKTERFRVRREWDPGAAGPEQHVSVMTDGQQFGGRDHTTVMHADRKIRSLMAERRSIYNQVTELTNRIKQQALSG